jgi:hypothetical protein
MSLMTDPVPIPSSGRGATSLPDRAKRIKADYAAIVGNGVVLKPIAFGELLTDTQAHHVGYGLWGSWLKSNCALGERTAQRYMNLAANKKKLPLEDPTRMSDLSLNDAFRMVADKAAKSTTSPDRAADNAVKALLENLWKLPPSSADYKVKDTIRQLQELLGKMQIEPA